MPRLAITPGDAETVGIALARAGTLSAALVPLALLLRLFTHAVAVFGFPDGLSIEQIRTVAFETRWGGHWQIQLLTAALLLASSILVRLRSATSRLWPSLACVALAYAIPLVGHAAGSAWRVLLHGTHILAGGIWLGSLAVMLLIRFPARREDDDRHAHGHERELRRTLLRGFAPVALTGATVLLLTGATMAWLYLGPLTNLVASAWGRLLDAKVVVLSGVVACGFVNWRRLAADSTVQSGPARSRIMMLEALLAAVVVLITAFLTETAHP
jgi:putative copper export protein